MKSTLRHIYLCRTAEGRVSSLNKSNTTNNQSFKKHSVLKTQCKETLNLIWVVAHLKWVGDRGTLLMLYRAGLRLALGAFCTSPVSNLHTEANEASLEECRLKLSMHYYLKTRACLNNPAHHALHEFDRITRFICSQAKCERRHDPTPDPSYWSPGRGSHGLCRDQCPLRTPNFPPGTHDYKPKKHRLIEEVSKSMISRKEDQAKFNEHREKARITRWSLHWWLQNEWESGAAAVINCHFQNGETTSCQLSKRLPDNSTIFAAIHLALNYYRYMGPVHHNVAVYSDPMSCLQAIEGEDTENPFICHIMNLLWLLNDKGTHVHFCWIPSHCGTEGNERVDQLAKESLDHDVDPLESVHYDLKPLVNSYIQQLFQIKWDVAAHGRDRYLLKPTLGPLKKFQHLTRAEVFVINRIGIGHTKATKAHIFFQGPRTTCHHCGQMLTINRISAPEVCSVTGESWQILHSWLIEYSLRDSSRDLHNRILAESGILLPNLNDQTYTISHLNHPRTEAIILTSTSPQTWTI